MGTPIQNFDLYELGGNTAADMYGEVDNKATAEVVRKVVEQHNGCVLDNKEDRETLIHALITALRTNT